MIRSRTAPALPVRLRVRRVPAERRAVLAEPGDLGGAAVEREVGAVPGRRSRARRRGRAGCRRRPPASTRSPGRRPARRLGAWTSRSGQVASVLTRSPPNSASLAPRRAPGHRRPDVVGAQEPEVPALARRPPRAPRATDDLEPSPSAADVEPSASRMPSASASVSTRWSNAWPPSRGRDLGALTECRGSGSRHRDDATSPSTSGPARATSMGSRWRVRGRRRGLATASTAGDELAGAATDADGTSATALGAGLGAPPDPPAFRPAPTTTSTSATTPTMAAGISHAGRRRSGRMGWARIATARASDAGRSPGRGRVTAAAYKTGGRKRRPVRAGGRGARGSRGMADPTGFEPAISSVTGWHVGPLHHGSAAAVADDSRDPLPSPHAARPREPARAGSHRAPATSSRLGDAGRNPQPILGNQSRRPAAPESDPGGSHDDADGRTRCRDR